MLCFHLKVNHDGHKIMFVFKSVLSYFDELYFSIEKRCKDLFGNQFFLPQKFYLFKEFELDEYPSSFLFR